MSFVPYGLARPFLFGLDPETAHELTLGSLARAQGTPLQLAYSNTFVPDPLELNRWALSGDWTVESRASVLNRAGGRIAFRFHARDVNLVLRSRAGAPVPFRVRVDGDAPGPAHGLDVDASGRGTLVEPRLYQLVREPGVIADRTFEIAFAAAGVEAYVFTFG